MLSQEEKLSISGTSELDILLKSKEKILEIQKDELRKESRKKWILVFFLLLVVLVLLLALVFSVYMVSEQTRIRSKADSASLARQIEFANSYLFASPLKAKASTGERIRITVFLLDSQGMGVSGKRVILGRDDRLQVEEVQPVSDSVGKAVFDVSSNSVGVYQVEASVDGKTLSQRVTLVFE